MNDTNTPVAESAAAPSGLDAQDALWYKDAVIYQLNVKSFFDSNDDGIGDFKGLTSKLEYIRDLGVNTIWLMPFYPSPLKDDGYDIADYGNTRGFRPPARRPPDRRRAISMSGATPIRNTSTRASSSPIPSRRTGPGTTRPRPTIGTASSAISPI